jgi:urease subunit beta
MIPGELFLKDEAIIANAGRKTLTMEVSNFGDRPIQVGSHFHFYEVNTALSFNRQQAFGMRLNIPSGTTVRFEPGDKKTVELVALAGTRTVYGLRNLTNGPLDLPEVVEEK